MEETSSARILLARDDYDAQRWKNEVADSREMLANSRSTVLNAVGDTLPETSAVSNTQIASNNPTNTLSIPVNTAANNTVPKTETAVPTFQPLKETKTNPDLTAKIEKPVQTEPVKETPKQEEIKKQQDATRTVPESTTANTTNQPKRERLVNKPDENKETVAKKEESNVPKAEIAALTDSPLNVGSLLEFAVQKTNPVYPATARSLRQSGVVRLEVVVDEEGKVSAVQNTSGPALLQTAAKDAVKKWKFKPFLRDGQPVKATGFVSFNFNL
jgi:TonB family protein